MRVDFAVDAGFCVVFSRRNFGGGAVLPIGESS
jgi:hypothetical protein